MSNNPLDPSIEMFRYVTSVKQNGQMIDAIAEVITNMVKDEVVHKRDEKDMNGYTNLAFETQPTTHT